MGKLRQKLTVEFHIFSQMQYIRMLPLLSDIVVRHPLIRRGHRLLVLLLYTPVTGACNGGMVWGVGVGCLGVGHVSRSSWYLKTVISRMKMKRNERRKNLPVVQEMSASLAPFFVFLSRSTHLCKKYITYMLDYYSTKKYIKRKKEKHTMGQMKLNAVWAHCVVGLAVVVQHLGVGLL